MFSPLYVRWMLATTFAWGFFHLPHVSARRFRVRSRNRPRRNGSHGCFRPRGETTKKRRARHLPDGDLPTLYAPKLHKAAAVSSPTWGGGSDNSETKKNTTTPREFAPNHGNSRVTAPRPPYVIRSVPTLIMSGPTLIATLIATLPTLIKSDTNSD